MHDDENTYLNLLKLDCLTVEFTYFVSNIHYANKEEFEFNGGVDDIDIIVVAVTVSSVDGDTSMSSTSLCATSSSGIALTDPDANTIVALEGEENTVGA
jgi:hypothetical protein